MPPEAVARIARLEVRARNVVEGFLSGQHRSPYFGQSVEFVQHRDYVPGDDIRRIDWKVWSKTDKYYLKQYEEDTNLRTTLLVDVSESMSFQSGGMSKWEYAASIAGALAYLLLKQQDAVGAVTFDATVLRRIPHSSKQTQLDDVLVALDHRPLANKTHIDDVLSKVADEQARRGMIVLISDLLAERPSLFRGLKLLRARGHDVLVFHVLDDAELDFEFAGTTRFEGMESAGDVLCDPRSLREGYLKAMREYLDEIRRFCTSARIDYQTIRTSEHLDAALRTFLSRRNAAMSRRT